MADIHIERPHGMSLAEARTAALRWATEAEEKFAMKCAYAEGETSDEVTFSRSGVSGTLIVDKNVFALQAKLGFLLSAFKEKIEGEIVRNLEALIKKDPAGQKTAAQKSNAAGG